MPMARKHSQRAEVPGGQRETNKTFCLSAEDEVRFAVHNARLTVATLLGAELQLRP